MNNCVLNTQVELCNNDPFRHWLPFRQAFTREQNTMLVNSTTGRLLWHYIGKQA